MAEEVDRARVGARSTWVGRALNVRDGDRSSVLIVGVIAVGVVLRIRAVLQNDLTPDALGYLQKAREYRFLDPWPAGEREPPWIALTKVAAAPFGYAPGVATGISLTLALGLLLASAVILRRHLPPAPAVVAVAVVAVHPALVTDASNGIREPAAVLLLLMVGHFWLVERPLPSAILAGALVGVRWELGLLALLLLTGARIGWRPLAAGACLAAGLMGPFLVANADEYDDPLHHSSYHALYYRNLEDAARAGVDPFSVPRYRGEPVTWSEYYLDYLGPAQATERVARGWPVVVAAMLGGASGFPSSFELRMGLVGILLTGVAAIFSPHRRLVIPSVLVVAGGASGYAALYRLMEYRLVSFLVLPLAVLAGLFVDVVANARADPLRVPVLPEASRNLSS